MHDVTSQDILQKEEKHNVTSQDIPQREEKHGVTSQYISPIFEISYSFKLFLELLKGAREDAFFY